MTTNILPKAVVALVACLAIHATPARAAPGASTSRGCGPGRGRRALRPFALGAWIAILTGVCTALSPAVAATIESIVTRYDGYDLDGDRTNEIVQLEFLWYMNAFFDQPSEAVNPSSKLVVVLVESRLLVTIQGSKYTVANLLEALVRFRQDLAAEGRQAKFLLMTDYAGVMIQDGKTLLAIREFFKSRYR